MDLGIKFIKDTSVEAALASSGEGFPQPVRAHNLDAREIIQGEIGNLTHKISGLEHQYLVQQNITNQVRQEIEQRETTKTEAWLDSLKEALLNTLGTSFIVTPEEQDVFSSSWVKACLQLKSSVGYALFKNNEDLDKLFSSMQEEKNLSAAINQLSLQKQSLEKRVKNQRVSVETIPLASSALALSTKKYGSI